MNSYFFHYVILDRREVGQHLATCCFSAHDPRMGRIQHLIPSPLRYASRMTRSRMTLVVASSSTEGRSDSTWQVDAFGVRNFGSTKPECKHSVAAFALYAFVALVRMIPEWGGSKMTFLIHITTSGHLSRDRCLPRSQTGRARSFH